jgi:DNA-binding LytR/AlgR family response regulator
MNTRENQQAQVARPVSLVSDGFFVKPLGGDMRVKINYDDIVWVEADNNHSYIHLKAGAPVGVAYNIRTLASVLPQDVFVKISRSEIVNIGLVNKHYGNALYLRGCSRSFSVTKAHRKYVYSCFVGLG